jgi:hypothetical protein
VRGGYWDLECVSGGVDGWYRAEMKDGFRREEDREVPLCGTKYSGRMLKSCNR